MVVANNQNNTTDTHEEHIKTQQSFAVRSRARLKRVFDGEDGSIIWLVKIIILGVQLAVSSANYWLAERRVRKSSKKDNNLQW